MKEKYNHYHGKINKFFVVEQTGNFLTDFKIIQSCRDLPEAKSLRNIYKKRNPNAEYFVVEVK